MSSLYLSCMINAVVWITNYEETRMGFEPTKMTMEIYTREWDGMAVKTNFGRLIRKYHMQLRIWSWEPRLAGFAVCRTRPNRCFVDCSCSTGIQCNSAFALNSFSTRSTIRAVLFCTRKLTKWRWRTWTIVMYKESLPVKISLHMDLNVAVLSFSFIFFLGCWMSTWLSWTIFGTLYGSGHVGVSSPAGHHVLPPGMLGWKSINRPGLIVWRTGILSVNVERAGRVIYSWCFILDNVNILII